jgi:hypothetical protein
MLGKSTKVRAKSILVLGLVVTSLAAWPLTTRAQDPAQSGDSGVAAAARKAREAKKTTPPTKKVYTDDDVRPAPPPPTETDKPAIPPPDGTTPTATPPEKNDEKTWRQRFSDQRAKIARAEKELDILQREEVKAQVQYYPDPQTALSEGYSRKDINEKDTKIAAKKDEVAQLKQGLDDLTDQLRKTGGDLGWSREQ